MGRRNASRETPICLGLFKLEHLAQSRSQTVQYWTLLLLYRDRGVFSSDVKVLSFFMDATTRMCPGRSLLNWEDTDADDRKHTHANMASWRE